MKLSAKKILLAGEGGQGVQSIAKIITLTASSRGLQTSYLPSFGVEQRGAPSVAFVVISRERIYYPRFDIADIVIILQKRAIKSVSDYIGPESKIIFDSSTTPVGDLPKRSRQVFGIPATKIAAEKFLPRAFNVLVCGQTARLLDFPKEESWSGVMAILGSKFKDEEAKKVSQAAYNFGFDFQLENKNFSRADFTPHRGEIKFKNKEKIGRVVPERCKGCALCLEICPVGALKFSHKIGVYGNPVPEVDLEKCTACGACFRICPDLAIKIERR